jgi:hypothetical protein
MSSANYDIGSEDVLEFETYEGIQSQITYDFDDYSLNFK